MASPQRIPTKEPQQVIHLSPCKSINRRRRISNDSNSPEFEFWMVRNPSFPQPNLLSADELFVDGVLLPLHLLQHNNNNNNHHHHHPDEPEPEPEHQLEPEPPNLLLPDQEPQVSPANITIEPTSSSKRWRDIIFKKSHDKKTSASKKQEEKEKKREKKGLSGAGSAELNINIWPFSRSRSAGNSGSRPKMVPGAPGIRKVSSAPCSRSNSSGESKSRKSWPSSPGRPGVHLGRSSPVWQVRRGGGGSILKGNVSEPVVRSGEKVASKKEVSNEARRSKNATNGNGSARAKVLNINVPICIGYRSHLSCRSDENSAIGVGGGSKNANGGGGGGGGGGGSSSGTINVGIGGNLFNLRSLFNKKVY